MPERDEKVRPMNERDVLAERFEENRGHLRAVAYRMLGSLSEADDAVQETWLRLSRSDTTEVQNLAGWLTTVVARVCLDMLRSRKAQREEPLNELIPVQVAAGGNGADPEQEAMLADSVGLALLVVLEKLDPVERLAFVLHDMFAVPFDEIAPIVGRTPAAARQLASRARRRVHGEQAKTGGRTGAGRRDALARATGTELRHQREVVDAFLAATRVGDFQGLLALLDPDVVLRSDGVVTREIRGAAEYARRAAAGGKMAAARGAWTVQPALVNGAVGIIVAPLGHLTMVLQFTFENGKIIAVDATTDPERLRKLELAVLAMDAGD
jgi:RNA polymerase sigma factor (sigma-70 family)